MKFKSSDASVGGVNKILTPGTYKCRIRNIKLETVPYDREGYNVVLLLEGEPEGAGFQGIAIDKLNPALGHYTGRVGFVKGSYWLFKDWEYKGKLNTRDKGIFDFIQKLARQLGVLDQMIKDKFEAETIEEYVEGINKYFTDPELWAYFTIAGKEYYTTGYETPNYRLFLPKPKSRKSPYTIDESNLMEFSEEEHIIKVERGEDVVADDDTTGDSSFPDDTPGEIIIDIPEE